LWRAQTDDGIGGRYAAAKLTRRLLAAGLSRFDLPPLFAGYAFVLIELQWHTAGWAPGTNGLVMSGDLLVRVPRAVIAGLRARGVDGYVELPEPRCVAIALIGSYLEPRIAGAALSVSLFLVLFAVFFWALLWGIASAFIGGCPS